ncbi:MAG TPA: SRPBCC family protein [Gaiellaceae bacterium]|nr:SRPBCC family protein [Gaiellaceae bacterium]
MAAESGQAATTVRYEARTTIDRPIGEVFARLADLDGYTTWMHRTGLFRRSGQTSDGPLGPGTAYFDATRMGTFRGQVTDYQPPSRIGFRETLRLFGSDLMEARPEYLLEADRDRTIVHHIAEGELFGLMRLMKPVAALLARSERTRTVESLRRSLARHDEGVAVDALRLHLEKDLAAPPERVFGAFAEASQLRQWWGPAGFLVPQLQFDAAEGASYRITMQPPDGDAFQLGGTFRIVEAPWRLVFTFAWEEPDPEDQETLVTLSFAPTGAGTHLSLDQDPFKTETRLELHRNGWTETLERLERFLS